MHIVTIVGPEAGDFGDIRETWGLFGPTVMPGPVAALVCALHLLYCAILLCVCLLCDFQIFLVLVAKGYAAEIFIKSMT